MSIEAMKQALEVLEGWDNYGDWLWLETALEQCKRSTKESLTALRQAIEQAEEQDTHCRHCNGIGCVVCDARCLPEQVTIKQGWDVDTLLAKPEQDPVAWVCEGFGKQKNNLDYDQEDVDALPVGTMLYTSPPQADKQEPVAYIDRVSGKPKFIDGYVVQTDYDIPLYAAPPRKEWVGLTEDDIVDLYCQVGDETEWAIGGLKDAMPFANLVEAKLKEKNT